MPVPKNRGRLWLGEFPLARKTILLHAEQGLGDTIQFARYVPQLVAAGATVVLEVPAELKPLMTGFGGAGSVIARGETPEHARAAIGQVVEGLTTAPVLRDLSERRREV